jgi:pyruvate dehydrogenase complex dehydrogenase (E1) component
MRSAARSNEGTRMTSSADLTAPEAPSRVYDQRVLREIARRVLWLSAAIVDTANAGLAFLADARGDSIRCLGVKEFGESSSLDDAYRIHHIDTAQSSTPH